MLGEKGNLTTFFTDLVKGNLTNLLSLPNDVHKTLNKLQKGELAFKIQGTEERNQVLYRLGQQFIYMVLLIASFTFVYLTHQNGAANLNRYALGASGLFLLLLLRSMWRRI